MNFPYANNQNYIGPVPYNYYNKEDQNEEDQRSSLKIISGI